MEHNVDKSMLHALENTVNAISEDKSGKSVRVHTLSTREAVGLEDSGFVFLGWMLVGGVVGVG